MKRMFRIYCYGVLSLGIVACQAEKVKTGNMSALTQKVSALSQARLFILQTKFTESRSVLENFIAANKKHEMAPEAQFLIGESYDMQKKYALAIAAYQKTVDDYPETPSAGTAGMMLSKYYVKQKKYDKALAAIKLSMKNNKMNSNREDGIFATAVIYDKHMQKPDAALAAYSKLLKDTQNPRLAPKSYWGALKIYQEKDDQVKVVQLASTLIRKYDWSKEAKEAKKILEKIKKK